MIVHDPVGIDDPYKATLTERFPRRPRPGDEVQVGFRVEGGAETAWIDVTHTPDRGEPRTYRAEARPLAGEVWSADLGAFDGGRVSYTLHAEPRSGATLSSGGFAFEVGAWRQVTGVAGAAAAPGGVELTLTTNAGPAYLHLTFPTRGACRLELSETSSAATGHGTTPHLAENGDSIHVSAEGVYLTIDRRTLSLVASTAEGAEPLYRGSLAFRWCERDDEDTREVEFGFTTSADEALYGLGERFTDANRNGQRWDVRVYEEYKEQRKRTYIPVPFIVSERGYGLWLDTVEPSYFDLSNPEAVITTERLRREPDGSPRPHLALVIFVAERPYGVTAAFNRLTGPANVPPAWAFRPWMSSNSWNSQARVHSEVERTLAEDVPAGVVVIEAWSDEATFYIFNDATYRPRPGAEAPRLADFEFRGRWPDPKAFIDHCHANGIRVVLWQIPVHKVVGEPHAQHDADGAHMLERGLAIRYADGSPYRNKGWWFTDALIADFSNPETVDWWFGKRRYLFEELGIDGMKTDGGEHLWGRSLRSHDGRRGLELYNAYANDYVGAYHRFVQEATSCDGVTFSRAGYTGAQRFPAHWAGDEDSTWSAYRASVRAGLSAGVCGISMWSWDLGGFSGEIPTVELYLRSAAMATFSPLMQYHSEGHGVQENRDRTPWNIAERHKDRTALDVYRRLAHLRLKLADYLHAEAVHASSEGVPLIRYPALEFPERHAFLAEDEYAYLLGRDLLVAPVTEKGCGTREVRLPPGRWVDIWSGSEFAGDRVLHAPAPLDLIPVFVRAESERLGELLEAAASYLPRTAE